MKISKSKFKLSNKNLLLGTCTVSAAALLMMTTPVAHAATVETSTATVSPTKTASVKESEETKANSESTEKVENQLNQNKESSTNETDKVNSEKDLNINETSTAENTVSTDKKNVVSDSEKSINSAAPVVADSSAPNLASPAISTGETSTTSSKKENKPALEDNIEATTPKLNDKVAEVVKNAGLDVSKLTKHEIEELNKIDFAKNDNKKPTNLTIKDLVDIGNTIIKQDPKYAVPFFNASEIKNMPAAYTRDAQTGKEEQLEIWDSWPVQDPVTGAVTNYHGYQLVIAMMGMPNKDDNHLYLLYNKYGDNNFENWKNAGSIFGYDESPDIQEWSGSAIPNLDGSIQLFYTLNDTNGKINDQQLATANIILNANEQGVSISDVKDNHVIFKGDGTNYQTYEQFITGENASSDDYCLRDPHVVELSDGSRYLVFEGNTGINNYQSVDQIYNWNNYGGDDKFNIENFLRYINVPQDKKLASLANAALGILKLDDNQTNPKVAEVYSPLVTALASSDELERPDVVKLGNKYYLFTATRFSRGTNTDLTNLVNKTVGDNVAMLGFVSDSLNGIYTPLNGSGAVLTASVPSNWRTATYSYYTVPVEGKDNQVLVTSYMTNRGEVAGEGKDATWAPSFLVQINPDNTTTVLGKMTKQGDWIWDDKSNDPNMVGVLDREASNSAALPDEWDKPLSPELIGHYGLRDHSPEPEEPEVPQNNTPITPDQPTNNTQTIEPPTVMDPTASVPTDDKEIPKEDPADPDVTPNNDVPTSGDKKQPNTPEKLTQGKKRVNTPPTVNKKLEAKKQEKLPDSQKLTENELPATGTNSSILSIVVGVVTSVLGLLGLVDSSKFRK